MAIVLVGGTAAFIAGYVIGLWRGYKHADSAWRSRLRQRYAEDLQKD